MPTSKRSIAMDIAAPPADVFSSLANLETFGDWLPRSGVYRGTFSASASKAVVGTTYTDRTPLGEVHGQVTQCVADRLLVFEQMTANGDLSIQISYQLDAAASGTHLVRTGRISTAGRLRPLHYPVVWATYRENLRTLRELKLMLEADKK